ncbi:MAG: quinone oxidoreductase [Rhodospirillales bacterium]
MVKAVRIHEYGGPEKMVFEDVDVGDPGPGEARVTHKACGLNYIDTYQRSGLYKLPAMPAVLGMEGAGTVEAVGSGVTVVKPGDRVAYAGTPVGAYCEARVMPAEKLVKLPDNVSFETGAACMLQGMTVQYLLRQTHQVKAGDTVLFHAAAGGVGLLACQWAKHLGATVIGTVSSDAKAELARAAGCDHPIIYTREDFVERVKEITDGKGVPIAYDSIGKDTLLKSLECLSLKGHLVTFGQASGPVENFPPALLGTRSASLTRPTLMHYTATRPDLEACAGELLGLIGKGVLKININQTYALADTVQAHKDLESRKTTGSTVLLP